MHLFIWIYCVPHKICLLFSYILLSCAKPSIYPFSSWPLQWHHNEHDGVSDHQPRDCLLHRLFRCRSKNKSKLRVNSLCERNWPLTGEFPSQRASNAENLSIWWRHHANSIRGTGESQNSEVTLVEDMGTIGAYQTIKHELCAWFLWCTFFHWL